jgi:hypothetical protein
MKRLIILIFCFFCLYARDNNISLHQCNNFDKHCVKFHPISHILVPTGIAYALKIEKGWESTMLTYLLTNLVDLDHLVANPVYDPNRCSINYHPLHSEYTIYGYSLLALHPQTRDVGTGLLIHMGLDYIDCELIKKKSYGQVSPINKYTFSHFLFWYGMGKYSNLKSDEMFAISIVWEAAEFKLPFRYAREDWRNKMVDLISNYLGFMLGRTG